MNGVLVDFMCDFGNVVIGNLIYLLFLGGVLVVGLGNCCDFDDICMVFLCEECYLVFGGFMFDNGGLVLIMVKGFYN